MPLRELLADIEAIADTCDWTPRWAMVRALRLYLAGEGAEILAIRKGREQIANGKTHDRNDLMRALEVIVAGTAAGPSRG